MPTLNWIGKEKVINHHRDVPYRVLEHQYGFSDSQQTQSELTASGNLIINGDNLEALKALLPKYEGKVDCIYIDPPYNTGNEGWVYNDNVNDPKILKWLGDVVGKEGEDLSRHDKWLCMMYPRLKLLNKLLSNLGVIFVSIDDIEINYLKLICDEIFGKNKYLSTLIWKSRQNKDNRNISRISVDHEYILCYGNTLKGVERDKTQFSNPDNDLRGPWVSANMVGLADIKARPNLHYDLINEHTGVNYGCPKMGWRYERNTMNKLISEDRILWPKLASGRPRKKQFLNEFKEDVTGFSSIIGNDIFTRDGTNVLKEIFNEKTFDFPKPIELLEELILQSSDENSIILDSFAGSGTTAHAVLNLNKEDGGNRKFILVEMEDYADTITAERVKRVIKGYGEGNNATIGTGGSFDYFTLGQPLFVGNGQEFLNEDIPESKMREYIWYSETRSTYLEIDNSADAQGFLGQHQNTAYYFVYQKNELTTLDLPYLASIKTKAEQYVIYADNCLLSKDFMAKHNIIFKKIPRDISRF
ncbi:DNA methylase N-4/N-6 [Spirosomataceae bacterium]|jgi:adenine-specific DNA-methyltransferase